MSDHFNPSCLRRIALLDEAAARGALRRGWVIPDIRGPANAGPPPPFWGLSMEALWERCLDRLREEVSSQTFERWFSATREVSREGAVLTVQASDSFSLETLRSRYGDLLSDILRQEAGEAVTLRLIAPNGAAAPSRPADPSSSAPALASAPKILEFLNPKYKFENFVVGASNEFAHACALRVANQPGHGLNPLFIYGGVGLGKTHLLHAIAHRIFERTPGARIHYTSSENFINELIGSLQRNRMSQFRSKYRKIDILLIDDIQFIAGKERTQEEFFFTFNALYETGKQIVITSDQVPKETPGLTERLRARFVWGMMADIGSPDFETKVAILQHKAAEQNFHLPPEVAHFIADGVRSNIRELEGCLIKLIFHASLHGGEIDVPTAQETLKQFLRDASRSTNIENIQRIVADAYQIKVSDLRSKNRSRAFAFPRQIAMYLSRNLTRASTTEIGRRFGGKDHSTVIHSTNKIQGLLDKDSSFRITVDKLKEKIEAS